jgi:octaprenyl-diphosphate synthase
MSGSVTDVSAAATRRPPPPALDPALLTRALSLCADELADAERRLVQLLHSDIAVIPRVGGHLAFAGGKRLRPMLTLLCARAVGVDDPAKITVAAVGELLHTATLLHDDVIDGGEFRRGRPSARMTYGNGMAVLTGDFCLARSLQAVAATGHACAVRSMADTVTRMAEGEVAQLWAAGNFDLDRTRYYDIIERKTAALIAWCSSVANLAPARFIEPLARYGRELGYAFQIADDVLDFAEDGERAVTGKDPGQDLRDGKMTLPLTLACEADPTLARQVAAALQAGPPMDDETVESILQAVLASGAGPAARGIAAEHARAAAAALDELPEGPATDALRAVTHYVVRRNS